MPSISSERTLASENLTEFPGHRAGAAFVRPSPVFTHGNLISHGFDLRKCVFTMEVEAEQSTQEAYPTEVFLPAYHFNRDTLEVQVSGGKWKVDSKIVDGGTIQSLKWWHAAGKHKISVKGEVRSLTISKAPTDEVGYFEQYRRSFCAVM